MKRSGNQPEGTTFARAIFTLIMNLMGEIIGSGVDYPHETSLLVAKPHLSNRNMKPSMVFWMRRRERSNVCFEKRSERVSYRTISEYSQFIYFLKNSEPGDEWQLPVQEGKDLSKKTNGSVIYALAEPKGFVRLRMQSFDIFGEVEMTHEIELHPAEIDELITLWPLQRLWLRSGCSLLSRKKGRRRRKVEQDTMPFQKSFPFKLLK